MKEFSWHTDDKPHISTYINGAPKYWMPLPSAPKDKEDDV